MTAVLGGDPESVLASLAKHGLTAANHNGPGQIVAAGTLDELAAFAADPPEGARLRPLAVAGAFHTKHMAPAVDRLAGLARSVTTHDARTRLISNKDGKVVHDGPDVLRRIVGQVASPVRWDLVMQTMRDLGVTGLLEIPPAGTLAGIAKRALPDVEMVALKTPADLDAARDLVARHGAPSPSGEMPSWRMLVAPAKGRFRRDQGLGDQGDEIVPGSAIGAVVGLRDEAIVLAPARRHGDRVAGGGRRPGQPRAADRAAAPDGGGRVSEVRLRSGDPQRHARILGFGAYRPARVVTNPRSSGASTPPTSGSASAPASSSGASPPPTRASSTWLSRPPRRPWPAPASRPTR